ncbi:MAG TPA: TonB-dependent receptor [Vicinamibacterales bacterium]|nr:TonB-dependent receptor [Vicinamibacterales bacterium]
MKVWKIVALIAIALVSVPIDAAAQAVNSTITGVVRDTSGAVLPGVTVEAASPALIEKVKSAVTDGDGLYRIVDLRPGQYTVTFALGGFKTFRREALELPANFTATVNADMSLGALEETVTVTGEAPIVDVQSTRQQTQYQRETLEALPGTGRLTGLSQVIPGATLANPQQYSVGGVNDSAQYTFSLHGAPQSEPIVDGMSQVVGGLTNGVFIYNQLTFAEVVVETSGVGADRETGGMQINIIQRDGGNTFSGGMSYSYAGPKLESDNLSDALIARNLRPAQVGGLKKYYDFAAAMGGPLKRDRVWFFGSFRSGDNQQTQQGNYFNARQGTLFYAPDTSRPANTDQWSKDYTGRVTWQVTQKHKIVVAASAQPNCNCFFNLLNPTGGIPWAPEVSAQHRYNPQVDTNVSWKVPVTDRLLVDTDFAYLYVDQRTVRQPSTGLDVQVTDTGMNYRYGSRALNLGTTGSYIFVPRTQTQPQFTVSYVTGSHVFKTGVMLRWFHTGDASRNTDPNQINQGRDYTFRNGTPTNVRIWAVPYAWVENGRDHSVFAQDQWTLRRRLTLNLGVRYNDTLTSLPEVHLAPGPFVGERVLPAVKNHPHWENLNPRVGAAFDLQGNGKTALKVSLGRYNPPLRSTTTNPPAAGITPSTNRTWNDNGNYIPDCDLLNPNSNGECGPWSDRTFGQNIIPTKEAHDAVAGFNRQGAFNGGTNWQFSTSMQRELRPGVGLNVGYFRTWYSGFLVTDNLAVTPADYDRYCFTAPTDSRLAMSGKQICGYDIKPAKFGLNDSVITQASNYGPRTQIFNGIDLTMNARLKEGAQFAGGLSTGRTVENSCATVDYPQDAKTGVGANIVRANTDPIVPGYCRSTPPWLAGTQVKFMLIYPLPFSLQTSVIYQNFSGIENTATYTATNAQIAPSLGRNLAQCAAGAACTATVTMALDPPGSSYEPRLQQVDLRFSRTLRLDKYKLRGNLDVANLFNANSVLSVQRQYGPTYLNVLQIMGGRLMKVGLQLDF